MSTANEFITYLVLQADTIRDVVTFSDTSIKLMLVVLLIIMGISYAESGGASPYIRSMWKYLKILIVLAVLFSIANAFIPSTDTMKEVLNYE